LSVEEKKIASNLTNFVGYISSPWNFCCLYSSSLQFVCYDFSM